MVAQPIEQKVIAIVWGRYEFKAENEDEVPFLPGEMIRVLQKDEEFQDGWWTGLNENNQYGIFPHTYTSTSKEQVLPSTAATGNPKQPRTKMSTDSAKSHVMRNTMDHIDDAIAAQSASLYGKNSQQDNNNDETRNTSTTHDGTDNISISAASDADEHSMVSLDQDDLAIFHPSNAHKNGEKGATSDDAAKTRSILAMKAAKELEKQRKKAEQDRLNDRMPPPPIEGLEISDESDIEENHISNSKDVSEKINNIHHDPTDISNDKSSLPPTSSTPPPLTSNDQTQFPVMAPLKITPTHTPKASGTPPIMPQIPTVIEPKQEENNNKLEDHYATASFAHKSTDTVNVQLPPASNAAEQDYQFHAYSIPDTSSLASFRNIADNTSQEYLSQEAKAASSSATVSTVHKPSANGDTMFNLPSASTEGAFSSSSGRPTNKPSYGSLQKYPSPKSSLSSPSFSENVKNALDASSAHNPPSLPPIVSTAPISSSMTNASDKSRQSPKDASSPLGDPSTWDIEQVIEWGKLKNFDATTLAKFREHEISGDILVEMDVNTLKEIDLPAFGRRVHIYNAIKELKHQQQQRAGGSKLPETPTSPAFSGYEPDTPGSLSMSADTKTFYRGSGSSAPQSASGFGTSFQYPIQYAQQPDGGLNYTATTTLAQPPMTISGPRRDISGGGRSAISTTSTGSRPVTSSGVNLGDRGFAEDFAWSKSQPPNEQQYDLNSASAPSPTTTATTPTSRFGGLIGRIGPYKANQGAKSSDDLEVPSGPPKKSGGAASFFKRAGRPSTSSGRIDSSAPKMMNGSIGSGAVSDSERLKDSKSKRSLFSAIQLKSRSDNHSDENVNASAGRISAPTSPLREAGTIKEEEELDDEEHRHNQASKAKDGFNLLEKIGKPDREGWLQKKSDQFGGWKLRYLVLKGNYLYYMKSNTEKKIKGWIDLTKYKIYADHPNKTKFGFVLMADRKPSHYFCSDDEILIIEWSKLLMKPTIRRNLDDPVVAPSTIETISLQEARTMFPPPRPPTPTTRSRVQAEYTKQRGTMTEEEVRTIMTQATPGGRSSIYSGVWSPQSSHSPTANYNSGKRRESSIPSSPEASFRKPVSPQKSVKRKQVSSIINITNNHHASTGSASSFAVHRPDSVMSVPMMSPDHQELLAWTNANLPSDLRANDFRESFRSGKLLWRLAGSLSGYQREMARGNGEDENKRFEDESARMSVMMDVFDYLLELGVNVGSVSMGEIMRGSEEGTYKLVWSIRTRFS